MATLQQLKDALVKAHMRGDTEAAAFFAEKIKNQPARSKVPNDFVPTQESLAQPQPQITPETPAMDYVKAIPEVAATVATGGIAGTPAYALGVLNQLGNEIAQGEFGSQEAADRIIQAGQRMSSYVTSPTESAAGQDILQTVAEATEPLAAVTPLAAEIGTATQSVINRVKSIKTPKQKRRAIAEQIARGEREVDIDNIIQTVDSKGDLITNPNVKRATKLLGDDLAGKHAAIQVEGMNNATRKTFNQMLDIVDGQHRKGTEYAMTNRVTDVLGRSLINRVDELKKIHKRATSQIDKSLKKIGDQPVNATGALDDFVKSLADEGIAVSRLDDGTLAVDMSGTMVSLGDVLPEAQLNRLLNILERPMTANQAHQLKRNIRQYVSYGGGDLQVGAKQSESISRAIKQLSSKLGDEVANLDEGYSKGNKLYQTVIEPLSIAQKRMKGYDLDSSYAEKKLAHFGKRIGSSLASKEEAMEFIDLLNESLDANGIKFDDDIIQQVAAIDLLDKVFRTSAQESPFGFQSQIRAATNVKTGNVLGAVSDAYGAVKNWRSPDFDDKMKALRAMTRAR